MNSNHQIERADLSPKDIAFVHKLKAAHRKNDWDDEWEEKSDLQLLGESQKEGVSSIACSAVQVLIWGGHSLDAGSVWEWVLLVASVLALGFCTWRWKRVNRIRLKVGLSVSAAYNESDGFDSRVGYSVEDKRFQILRRLRKWRSDLDGDEVDLELLNNRQCLLVQSVWFLVHLIWITTRILSTGFALWFSLAWLVGALLLIAHYIRLERCRVELEKLLSKFSQEKRAK